MKKFLSENKIIIGVIIFTILLVITSCTISNNRKNNTVLPTQTVKTKQIKNYKELQTRTDKLQTQYFNIMEHWEEKNFDEKRGDLLNLAESYISKDNSLLMLLNGIDKNYQLDYNNEDYPQVDKDNLLNSYNQKLDETLDEICEKIKIKIPKEDYVSFEKSQTKWEQDLIRIMSMTDTSEGTMWGLWSVEQKYYAKRFRILLLLPYLQ